MLKTFRSSACRETTLLHFSMKGRWDGSFGQTWADNSIHRVNNEGVIDHAVGATAQVARHVGKLGNDAAAFITNKPKRPAYAGIYGQTRADAMEVLSTPWRLLTEKNKLGTLVNGVTSLFDVAYDGLIVDPLTLAAGDHANTPRGVRSQTHASIQKAMKESPDFATAA